MLSIDLCNDHPSHQLDEARLHRAVAAVLADAGIARGSVSIAVVDDPKIHELNRQYLAHDYPTDVLSFVLEAQPGELEGEVIVSADTAARMAESFHWTADDELLLYVIHGTLHLVGYDDLDDEPRQQMRAAEQRYLALLGLTPRQQRPGDDAN